MRSLALLQHLMMLAMAWLVLAGCPVNTAGPTVLPPASTKPGDEIREGDKLQITVRGQEDLSGDYSVAADGTIRFPRIGSVVAAALKPTVIAQDIESRLADGWLRDPHVSVLVAERRNPEEVTVLGAVKEQGTYTHDGKLTIMKAISLAGGLNPLAHRRKVNLIRETTQGRKTYEIDVQAIMERGAEDVSIEPGDVIVVPESPV